MSIVIDGAKTLNGRTIWTLTDDGRLEETGPGSYKFALSPANTLALFELMERHKDLIKSRGGIELKQIRYETEYSVAPQVTAE